MPLFYFHLHTGNFMEADLRGAVFATLEDAVADAGQARTEFMRDEAIDRTRCVCRFEITDAAGRTIAAVPRGNN
jgi:hypothetical protein